MNYKLPKETLDVLVNYLAKKPYIEVYQLIEQLRQLEQIKDKQTNGTK